jgi:hypothetical protein
VQRVGAERVRQDYGLCWSFTVVRLRRNSPLSLRFPRHERDPSTARCFASRTSRFAQDDTSNVLGLVVLVGGSGKQQQIPIRILDDEILGAPGLLLQLLVKGNISGLKLKKQQLDLFGRSDGHRG